MANLRSEVVYLQMLQPPARAASDRSALLVQLQTVTVEQYLELYRGVGSAFNWNARIKLPAEKLAKLLEQPGREVHVLAQSGESAGFVELDRRSDDVEIVYFGLMPAFIGRGLGGRFLDWVVDYAWSRGCRRLWLHTCDLDHPAALPNYQRAGFEIYDREWAERDDLDAPLNGTP